MQSTLIELFRQNVRKHANRPLLYEKRDTEYRPTSYRAGFEIVAETAAGLMQLGLSLGDRCILYSEGRSDWLLSELGILYAGGIVVPLSENCIDKQQIRFRASHTGAKFIIVSENLLHKILPLKKNLPRLKKIIVLHQAKAYDSDLMVMSNLRKAGKNFLKKHPDLFEKRWQSVQPEAPATISYTSGSLGQGKAIVLSHANYLANLEQIQGRFIIKPQHIIAVLPPWDHPMVHTCGLYLAIASGASFAGIHLHADTIVHDFKSLRPHILIAASGEMARLKQLVHQKIESKRSSYQKRFHKALQTVASCQGDGFQNNRWQGPPLLKSLIPMLDKLVFGPIHQFLGGRLQFIMNGGSYLDKSIQKFFTAIGIPVYTGYGLTEASPVVATTWSDNLTFGTAGHVLSGINIKLCRQDKAIVSSDEAGEIFIKGPNVSGSIWENQKIVSSLFQNSWLATGDIGYLDKKDNLHVLGRKANVIHHESGEWFSPEPVESIIQTACPLIQHILLYNQGHANTTALIIPDSSRILAWLTEQNLNHQEETGQTAVLRCIADAIHQSSHEFPEMWHPKTWALIGESFDFESGFLNTTQNVVRHKAFEAYSDRIHTLYTDEGRDPDHALNRIIISRMAN